MLLKIKENSKVLINIKNGNIDEKNISILKDNFVAIPMHKNARELNINEINITILIASILYNIAISIIMSNNIISFIASDNLNKGFLTILVT